MRRLYLLRLLFILMLSHQLGGSSRFSRQLCGLYGQQPCTFVPAPSGVTPICASPGKTYCEQVPQYPIHIIRRLIEKLGVENANDLIVDESIDEFDATRMNQVPQGQPSYYGAPPPLPPQQQPPPPPAHDPFNQFNHGYSYPKPNEVNHQIQLKPAVDFYGQTPNVASAFVHTNDAAVHYAVNAPSGLPYTINQRQPPATVHNYYYRTIGGNSQYLYRHYAYDKPGYYRTNKYHTEYSPTRWFKRFVRDLSNQKLDAPMRDANISAKIAPRETGHQYDDGKSNYRPKRQSPGRMELCETNYQYVTPQAALNSQGNWMYVVNQVDSARQLVRTETCASSVCSNLCSLPNGYGSRCEQKYVQKRLIAVNGDGTNLYTDTFWFPSCCACTLARY